MTNFGLQISSFTSRNTQHLLISPPSPLFLHKNGCGSAIRTSKLAFFTSRNHRCNKKCSGMFVAFGKLSYLCIAFEKSRATKWIGALVQLVRIHACHAWGHGFESRTHRKICELESFTTQVLFLFVISGIYPIVLFHLTIKRRCVIMANLLRCYRAWSCTLVHSLRPQPQRLAS